MAGTVPAVVRAALDETGLHASALEVELTESVMMRDSEATELQLAELTAMGVSVSLDDFGTGWRGRASERQKPHSAGARDEGVEFAHKDKSRTNR